MVFIAYHCQTGVCGKNVFFYLMENFLFSISVVLHCKIICGWSRLSNHIIFTPSINQANSHVNKMRLTFYVPEPVMLASQNFLWFLCHLFSDFYFYDFPFKSHNSYHLLMHIVNWNRKQTLLLIYHSNKLVDLLHSQVMDDV